MSDKSGKQSLYPDGDPDRHQNLIICSLAYCQPSMKISCKSVWTFLHQVANRQTNKQRQKHILLSGRKNATKVVGAISSEGFQVMTIPVTGQVGSD